MEFLAPGFIQAQLWLLQEFGESELTEGRSLSLFLSAFQINMAIYIVKSFQVVNVLLTAGRDAAK